MSQPAAASRTRGADASALSGGVARELKRARVAKKSVVATMSVSAGSIVAPDDLCDDLSEALVAAGEDAAASVYPMKRLGTPEDVASLIGFLVSEEASWITGETIRVDGGLLATGGL